MSTDLGVAESGRKRIEVMRILSPFISLLLRNQGLSADETMSCQLTLGF